MSSSNNTYAAASFLIYSCFETAKKVGGSLLIDSAMTEAEAQEKKLMYEARFAEYNYQRPCLSGDSRRITYIKNNPEWWSSTTRVEQATHAIQ
jgi:hypothetical protein